MAPLRAFTQFANQPYPPGFDLSKVSNVKNAEFDSENGVFTNITGNITYTYDYGQGQSVKFILARTSINSLAIIDPDPIYNISTPPLVTLLSFDPTLPEGDAPPDGGLTDLREDQESSDNDLDISDPSEGLVTDEGEAEPDTDSLAISSKTLEATHRTAAMHRLRRYSS